MESADKKRLIWISSQSGINADETNPCPGGEGGATGNPCPPPEDCDPLKEYDEVNNLQGGEITAPKDQSAICAGDTISVSSTLGVDDDPYHYRCQNPNSKQIPPPPGTSADTITITWNDGGAGGTFSSLTGANVSYTPPKPLPLSGEIKITATYDDKGTPFYDDSEKKKSVTVT